MAVDGDYPITQRSGDRLQRKAGAESFAEDIRDVDASEGYVVAVVGPWGSGKTSIVNMVKECLRSEPELPIVDFNPWLFSSTGELIDAFLRELSAQLKLRSGRFADIAAAVDDYSTLLSPAEAIPFVGAWVARFRGSAQALKEFQEKRRGSVTEQRDKIAEQLRRLDRPIVVVIDDIDRLESSEIRDVFRLVRLTASFPNVVYILAFDRTRVEDALGASGFDGRAYLEKIVQLGIDVPSVPGPALLRQIGETLDAALNNLDVPNRFDADIWPDVLVEIVRPLMSNMRSIKRYATAARSKVRALRGEVEVVDVLALEAVRLFLPDVFRAVVEGRDGLTTTAGFDARYEDPGLKAQVRRVVDAGADHPDVVQSLIRRIFPAGQRHIENNSYGSDWLATWLKGRRVAHPAVMATYLEQVASDSLQTFGLAERAFAVLDDEAALMHLLSGYDIERLQDVIGALESFEGDFAVSAVVPASRVLLNVLPDLPERPSTMLSFGGARLVVVRVVLRLLRQLESPGAVLVSVRAILPAVSSLSSKLELITLVGHREGAGHELVTESDAGELEAAFTTDLRSAPPGALATEQDVIRLLLAPKHFAVGDAVQVQPGSRELTKAVLVAGRSVVMSQSMGSRAVRRTTRLHWGVLLELFGGEDDLRAAAAQVRDDPDEKLAEALELVDRYLTGWRPDEWSH